MKNKLNKHRKYYDVYLGLGSNIGNSKQHLSNAIIEINTHNLVNVQRISKLYNSKPVDTSNQNNFLNAAIKITTCLTPLKLLVLCKEIENLHQRTHLYHWGPRTLDIDILVYDNKLIQTKQLTIPHKEIRNRDFVIKPLLDISPELTLPHLGLIAKLTEPVKNIISSELMSLISC